MFSEYYVTYSDKFGFDYDKNIDLYVFMKIFCIPPLILILFNIFEYKYIYLMESFILWL